MTETRIAPRLRVLKAGHISFGGAAIDCKVRNLSRTGAALEVASQIGVPDTFMLVMTSDNLTLHCHVVWRKQFRIGVAFD
jgi:PilZ domain